MKRHLKVLACVAARLGAVTVFAPDQPREQYNPQQQRPGAEAAMRTSTSSDTQIATCLVGDNQMEIAVAEIAKQRAKDREVKQFADKAIQDHSQFVQQLQRFAGA